MNISIAGEYSQAALDGHADLERPSHGGPAPTRPHLGLLVRKPRSVDDPLPVPRARRRCSRPCCKALGPPRSGHRHGDGPELSAADEGGARELRCGARESTAPNRHRRLWPVCRPRRTSCPTRPARRFRASALLARIARLRTLQTILLWKCADHGVICLRRATYLIQLSMDHAPDPLICQFTSTDLVKANRRRAAGTTPLQRIERSRRPTGHGQRPTLRPFKRPFGLPFGLHGPILAGRASAARASRVRIEGARAIGVRVTGTSTLTRNMNYTKRSMLPLRIPAGVSLAGSAARYASGSI